MLQKITLALFVLLMSACSFKVEGGYHGQTGRDDRVISQSLYPETVDQRRSEKQRY